MNTPSVLLGPTFLSIFINGSPYTLYKDDIRFERAVAAYKDKNWNKLEKIVNTKATVEKYSLGHITIQDGQIYFKGNVVNNTICTKILEFIHNDYPFLPMVRFLRKLLDNPDQRSIEQLYSYIENYRLPICDDGDFLAYKAVRNDMTDKFTGKIKYKVGSYYNMPREKVDPSLQACNKEGYHCGNVNYVKWYGSETEQVILVKVNPKNVVSCPIDHDRQKLRVCGYRIIEKLGLVKDLVPFEYNYAPLNNSVISHAVEKVTPQKFRIKRDANGRFMKNS